MLAAPTIRDAQSAFTGTLDVLTMVFGGETAEAGAALQQILRVDPTNADALAHIGVDVAGPALMFSEDVFPTFVVHLADPAAMHAFLEQQRQGLHMTSQVADGIEVFSAVIDSDMQLSWALDKDWLWVHFATDAQPFVTWFEHSHHAAGETWTTAWEWAQKQAKGQGLTGFVQLRDLLAAITKEERAFAACAAQFSTVERMGIAIAGDGKTIDARLSFQTPTAPPILPPPPGWSATAHGMPLAAEWNADLRSIEAWLEPCAGKDVHDLDAFGLVTLRAFVQSLDADDKSGVGAVSADLSSKQFINAQLDQVPMRSRLEKDRQFGAYKGKHLSVPFVATVDYVLDDKTFIAAMGDGVLTKVATGTPVPAAIGTVDVIPSGLPVDTWTWLLEQIGAPNPKQLAQRLQGWQQLHVGARHDGNALLIEAVGTRR